MKGLWWFLNINVFKTVKFVGSNQGIVMISLDSYYQCLLHLWILHATKQGVGMIWGDNFFYGDIVDERRCSFRIFIWKFNQDICIYELNNNTFHKFIEKPPTNIKSKLSAQSAMLLNHDYLKILQLQGYNTFVTTMGLLTLCFSSSSTQMSDPYKTIPPPSKLPPMLRVKFNFSFSPWNTRVSGTTLAESPGIKTTFAV